MDEQRFDGFARFVGHSATRRWGVAAVVAGLARHLLGAGAAAKGCGNCGDGSCIDGECWPDAEEKRFLTLINNYRTGKGLNPLRHDPDLGKAAELHSQYQAARKKMSHSGRGGSSTAQRIRSAGYNYSLYGENVLWHSANGKAGHAFRGWRKSPSHQRNMLKGQFRDIGIARARASNGAWYWTTDFGQR